MKVYQALVSIKDFRDFPATNDAVHHLNEEMRDALQEAMRSTVRQLEKDYRISLELVERR